MHACVSKIVSAQGLCIIIIDGPSAECEIFAYASMIVIFMFESVGMMYLHLQFYLHVNEFQCISVFINAYVCAHARVLCAKITPD